MNFVHFSLVLCMMCTVLFMNINAYAVLIKDSAQPGHPGLCYFEDIYSAEGSRMSLYIKPGVSIKHPKSCIQLYCSETLELSVIGCGIAQETDKCSFVEGVRTDPHPDCCGKIHCIEE